MIAGGGSVATGQYDVLSISGASDIIKFNPSITFAEASLFTFNDACNLVALSNGEIANGPGFSEQWLLFNILPKNIPDNITVVCEMVSGFLQCSLPGPVVENLWACCETLNIGDSAEISQGDGVCWQIQLGGYFYR
jgi:hypothetical protein